MGDNGCLDNVRCLNIIQMLRYQNQRASTNINHKPTKPKNQNFVLIKQRLDFKNLYIIAIKIRVSKRRQQI